MEVREETFPGRGKKPDDFALIETSIEGESGTYPRLTKRQLEGSGWGMDEYKETKEKRIQMRIRHLKTLKVAQPWEAKNIDKELEVLESIKYKWVRFKYTPES